MTSATLTAASPRILMVVTYDITESDRSAFEEIAGTHAASSGFYPGCLSFTVGRDLLHSGRYQLTELWQSQADLDEHVGGETFRRTVSALKALDVLSMRPDRYEVA